MPFLFSLLVMVLILGLIYWFITLLPLPDPFKQIAIAIVVVMCLIYLFGILFGGFPAFPVFGHYR